MNVLTLAQEQAIQERGNVLVVAGAGTGKTSTLVQRCVRLLVEEDCSLDEILMVTFTEAAAAQMRSRIRAELLRLQASLPEASAGAEKVQEQVALLDTAHICTLHGFCLQLVRAHFYQLGIDPAVIVLDEKQTAPLIAQTLDALFNRYYASDTMEASAVQELIRDWGGGADQKIRSKLVRLHRYTQALGDPDRWLSAQEAIYREETPVAWRRWFESGFDGWRKAWLPELRHQSGVPAVDLFIQTLAGLSDQPTFEQASEALGRLREAEQNKENWPRGTATSTRKALKTFFAELDFMAACFEAPKVSEKPPAQSNRPGLEQKTDPFEIDWHWVRPHVCTLLRLTREFTGAFSEAKREQGGVDFSDLEQFAIRLLRDPSIARQWQQRLRFIFVDECQDINGAQDAIITALSREATQPNRFLVGDVKQSIYRFRLASPKIFCNYEEQWREPGRGGARIPLADNFRSRQALLDFINPLFAALMRPEVGGVAYDQDVHLRFGNPEGRKHLSLAGDSGAGFQPATPGVSPANSEPRAGSPEGRLEACPTSRPRVELHWIDHTNIEGEAADGEAEPSEAQAALLDLLTIEREARLVALRLRELREQRHQVWDEEAGEFRPVDWRDLVVLMRSPSGKAEAFAKEFNRLGVPLSAARSGFFQSIEIQDLLSLLKLIDNPLQDVPLLAVLRSPLAGLSLDELAEVRAHNSEKPFWMALNRFHHQLRSRRREGIQTPGAGRHDSNELAAAPPSPPREERAGERRPSISKPGEIAWSKTDVFLHHFDRWRELARQTSLSHCLETVLTETHYEALLLAEPRGEERAANVRRFLGLAREYDPYRRQGLYRFLRFVEAQEEAEVELEPASAQTENAVRLMSIHKSKGLEFPVVVLAGLGVQFNLQDLRQDILLHETYGLCPKVKPPGIAESYPSLPYWLAGRDERRELLGEEMRLLYVALTRARDTLILTGSGKEPRWSSIPRDESCRSRREEAHYSSRKDQSLLTSAPTVQLSTREILSARSYLGWLKMWLPQVTAPSDWTSEQEGQSAVLRWRLYAANDPQLMLPKDTANDASGVPVCGGELDEMGLLKLQEQILWNYPFSAATVEPAVKRVSTLIWDRAEAGDDAQLLFNYSPTAGSGIRGHGGKRPKRTLAAADIGSAHHRFLEMVPLGQVNRLENLEQHAAQMVEEGALTVEEAEALDFKSLLAFWRSEIGQRILSQESCVHREIPFTARFSTEDFAALNLCSNAPALAGEYFVVRGKADLAVLLPREIWLLDFKTDQITGPESEEKIRQYAPQLKLYALGLGRIYRRPVTHRWLHFLAIGKTVSV